jgi:hypothetical protein
MPRDDQSTIKNGSWIKKEPVLIRKVLLSQDHRLKTNEKLNKIWRFCGDWIK